MVVHLRFVAKRLALRAVQMKAEFGSRLGAMLVELGLVIFEERFVPVRAVTVRAAVELHLEQAEVETELELRQAVGRPRLFGTLIVPGS
jgi:hypothetical protein